MRYVYLNYAKMHLRGWIPRLLPRELRFFRTECTTMHADGHFAVIQDLPSKLEEIHLLHGVLHGKLLIAALPPAMRIFRIISYRMDRAVVSVDNLPASLVSLVLHRSKLKHICKVVAVGEAPMSPKITVHDAHVKTETHRILSRKSHHYSDVFPIERNEVNFM